jgi:hypothetical protein
VEGSGIKARWDAQAPPAGEDEFQRWSQGRVVVLDVDGEEGDRSRGVGRGRQAVALLECSSPGREGGDGKAMAFAEGSDRESAGLPAFNQSSPVLFFTGIAGLAVGHGWNLQERVKKDHGPKVTIATRTGSTVRLLCLRTKSPLTGQGVLAMPLFGAHMSIAGGLHNALLAAEAHGCSAVQIFKQEVPGGCAVDLPGLPLFALARSLRITRPLR